ncbi:hypothetical protein MMC18_009072 [Xylographa bjoerkii]|nr:hypothetical protein [Xylographa bjoerkii]
MCNRSENLWMRAASASNDKTPKPIDFGRFDKLNKIGEVLEDVKKKRDLCSARLWKYKKRNGQVVILRESLEKVVGSVAKFKEVGDAAVQYDPSHAALPWAGVRLLLQVTINDVQIYGAMFESLELVSSLIARFAEVEDVYLCGESMERKLLTDSIVVLYTAILVYLTEARRYYGQNTGERIVRSFIKTADMSVETFLRNIQEQAAKVDVLARSIDGERIKNIEISMRSRFDDMKNEFDDLRQDLELVTWLNAVYTDDEYERALTLRLDGTCDWFLQGEQFQSWMAPHTALDARILWIHGPAGFGKTILTARLVHYLHGSQSLPTAFFFCKSENDAGRHPLAIVRSWVAQLINKDPDALEALFKTINLRNRNCVFVVDGFDECINTEAVSSALTTSDRTAFLRELIHSAENTGIRILIVSRNESDIRYQLGTEHATTSSSLLRFFEYEIATEDTKSDIKDFADSVVGQELSNKSVKLRSEISETAANKSHGMFLWVELLRRRLSRGKTPQQLWDTVCTTPPGLDQAYERDVKRILELDTDQRDRAIGILRWTLFALRPLTVGELTESLMTEVLGHFTKHHADDSPDGWDQYYANEQIRDLCGTLIEFRGQKDSEKRWTVHFVHSLVREHLLSTVGMKDSIFEKFSVSKITSEQSLLAKICLQYLCSDVLHERRSQKAEDFQKLLKEYQFLEHASRHWCLHAKNDHGLSKDLQTLLDRLFEPKASRWITWSEVFETKDETYEQFEKRSKGDHPSPLYYASLLGLFEALKRLQNQGLDLNAKGGKYGSALQAAAVYDHKDLVTLLLENGANVNITGGEFGSAIVGAAATTSTTDSSAVVQILVAKGADISKTDRQGRTAIYYAAMRG